MTRSWPDWDSLFHDRILPVLGVKAGCAAEPQWVFVGGQPGSGKSTRVRHLQAQLGLQSTQVISIDAIYALLPEVFGERADTPAALAAQQDFTRGIRKSWINALVDRAVDLRAHVLWERHVPSDTVEIAILAREMGYRTGCQVLAFPLLDSWLASLQRETAPDRPADRVPSRIEWAKLQTAYSRWPAFLAQAEDRVAFDSLQIIRRDGQVLFANTSAKATTERYWQDPPFAAESLMVERLAPRTQGEVQALLAQWHDLRACPDIAFQNHEAWPNASFQALGDALRDLCHDPSAAFDLDRAEEFGDPRAAQGWIARLQAEAAAVLAQPEASLPLRQRIDRLLALVSHLALGRPS